MRRAGDILTELFKEKFGKDFAEIPRTNAGLFSSWDNIVTEAWSRSAREPIPDEDIPPAAAHSRIRDIERGIILVEADHPGWVQILQTKQAALLSVIRQRYPELDIRGMNFRLSR